jgi:hypothetical protein
MKKSDISFVEFHGKLTEGLPLLSAWGRAIEAGQDAKEHYERLMAFRDEFPDVFKEAVLYAESIQQRELEDCDFPFFDDGPLNHPGERLKRVKSLKSLLDHD